jgi:hypothetical protein
MALYQGAASPLAEKTPPSCGNESGHDFSPAEKAAKSTRALAPAVGFSRIRSPVEPVSAIRSVVPKSQQMLPGFTPWGTVFGANDRLWDTF